MFKVIIQDTRMTAEAFCENSNGFPASIIFSKSFRRRSGVLIVDVEHIPQLFLVFLLLCLKK